MELLGPCFSWVMTGFSLGVISTIGLSKLGVIARYFKISSNMIMQNKRPKLVLVARNNLMMGKGKVASQCAHAAVSCYNEARTKQPEIVNSWLLLGQPKVVLRIDESEDNVLKLATKAKESGLVACIIRDAGRTQVQFGTVTVVGIGPGMSDTIDKITGHLKLM